MLGAVLLPAYSQGNWEQINPPNFVQVDVLALTPDGTLTVSNNLLGPVYTSGDAGRAWTVKGGGSSGAAVFLSGSLPLIVINKSSLAAHPSGDLVLLATYLDGAQRKGLFRSADRGGTYTLVGQAFASSGPDMLQATAAGDLVLMLPDTAAGVTACKVSRDKGGTWEDAGSFAAVDHFASDPAGALYVAGRRAEGGPQALYRSRNADGDWDSLWAAEPAEGGPQNGDGESEPPEGGTELPEGGAILGLAANREGAALMALDKGRLAALLPGRDTIVYGTFDTAGAAAALALTDDLRAVAGVPGRGVLFSDRDLAGFAAVNAGLGTDTAGIRPSALAYDKDGNLFLAAGRNLYVLRAAGSSAMPRGARKAKPAVRGRSGGSGAVDALGRRAKAGTAISGTALPRWTP